MLCAGRDLEADPCGEKGMRARLSKPVQPGLVLQALSFAVEFPTSDDLLFQMDSLGVCRMSWVGGEAWSVGGSGCARVLG